MTCEGSDVSFFVLLFWSQCVWESVGRDDSGLGTVSGRAGEGLK